MRQLTLFIWFGLFVITALGAPRGCDEDYERLGGSLASISVVEGDHINLWSQIGTNLKEDELQLQLNPNFPAVIGRADGDRPPYLDPRYAPTTLMPGGGSVMKGSRGDNKLSRAHFQLIHHPEGILLVNGVPAAGGGIRAPINGTELLSPENRAMHPGEGYLIKSGERAKVKLPNGTVLLIQAS